MKRGGDGFTLLEVLIAFVIAALALAVLYRGGLVALRATHAAAKYQEAIVRARSHLTLATHTEPLVAGDWRGDDGGGFIWRVRVTPEATTVVRPPGALPQRPVAGRAVTLYSVSVWIGWNDSGTQRTFRLDTEQLASQ
ncbi:MAG: prepilin-type N-terminal cleavage/methylation domain-containing protein [Acetobacteraceae bacterium]|nr:prepilin-type N-terminal cleavage/methylation domain-containing protein [Acetobacteraceae bacterium]